MSKQKTKILEGWRELSLDQVCENLDNLRRPVAQNLREPGNIPYYGATGVVDYVKDFIFDDELLLVGEDGADWSKFANAAYIIRGKSWVNNHAHILKCKTVNILYLQNYLNFIGLDNYISGSTRGKLTKGVLMNIKILLPSLATQNKIADILGIMDEEIEKVSGVIEKSAKTMQGLMNKLLKQNQPNWELVKIGRIGGVITGNTPKTSEKENYGDEFIWVSPKDIGSSKYVFNSENKLSKIGFSKIRRIPTGSIMVVCIGSTVGKMALAGLEMSANQQINSLTVKESYNNEFIYYQLLNNKHKIIKKVTTQAVPIINKTTFSEIELPIPKNIEIQNYIANILSSLDNKILIYQKIKNNLTQLKKGLMADLLSGKKII